VQRRRRFGDWCGVAHGRRLDRALNIGCARQLRRRENRTACDA
jgi:hypothetical protein